MRSGARGYLDGLLDTVRPVRAVRPALQPDWGPTRLPEALEPEPFVPPTRPAPRRRAPEAPVTGDPERLPPRLDPGPAAGDRTPSRQAPKLRVLSAPAESPPLPRPVASWPSPLEPAQPVRPAPPAQRPGPSPADDPVQVPASSVVQGSPPPAVGLPERPAPVREEALDRLEQLSRRFGSLLAAEPPQSAEPAPAVLPARPVPAEAHVDRPVPVTLPATAETPPPAPRLEIGRIEVFVAAPPAPLPAPVPPPPRPMAVASAQPRGRLSRPPATYGLGQG